MHIAFVMNAAHGGRGGMEQVLQTISRELRARGHVCTLHAILPFCHHEFTLSFSDTYISMAVPRLLRRSSRWRPRALYRHFARQATVDILSHLAQRPPDIIMWVDLDSHSLRAADLLARFRHQCPHTRLIAYPHNRIETTLQRHPSLARQFLQTVDAALAISSGTAAALRQIAPPDFPVITIYNPIPTASPVPRPESETRFVYIGRMDKNKRIIELLTVLSRLRGRWRCDFIGSATTRTYQSRIEETIQRYGLQHHVRLHGWQQDPWSTLSCASVTLLHSRSEGLPLVLMESIMRGIPCVAADCPTGPADIIQDGQNGWLYPLNAEHQLAQILQEIIDGTRPLPASETVRATAERFETDTIITRLTDTWEHMRYSSTPPRKLIPCFVYISTHKKELLRAPFMLPVCCACRRPWATVG